MALDASVFEKLGAFYLGRPYDLPAKKAADDPLLYDSRDLVTHAVCVGMTGSGKTGLCLALLEEAAMDDVPAIIIDPKGDLGNLLLTFPNLAPEDFLPWIDPDEARRQGLEPAAFAARQAELWRNGLASWGETPERIRTLREKVDMAIYTPGSTSGLPVNVLASFDAPATEDEETLAEKIQTTVAGLLGLVGIDADAVNGRESIFLSALISAEWAAGRSLDLPRLIELIQHPTVDKVGVLDLETFYPAKDRFALVMALNNVLASPSFASWQKGEPLDAAKFLYTPEGKPRLSIFSLAHLGDNERMFFVSLLLNEVLAWTRAQSGTSSLRAIVYMDEIFGYLPPTGNPPSKRPMLTLLKQARASGVGIVLTTQNPVDLDYKALSNAGTWFIGRLQTERDKARVLDGLEGAAGGGKFDRAAMERTLAGLGKRVFLMNNVHEDGPIVFETRWTMSYLRGPLTRDQIRSLMAVRKTSSPAGPTPPVAARTGGRPALPPGIPQVFLPGASGGAYSPRLLGVAKVRFSDAKLGVEETRDILLCADFAGSIREIDWGHAQAPGLALTDLAQAPEAGASFAEVPSAAATAENYKQWEKDFATYLVQSERLSILRCPELKLAGKPGENEAGFRLRLTLALKEHRDAAVDALRARYAPKFAALQARLARAEAAVQTQKEQATQAKWQTAISVGATIAGALLGRRALSSSTFSKAATAARGVSRSVKEGSDVATAEQSSAVIRQQIAELETDLAAASAALGATLPTVETVEIKPARGGIDVRLLALAWQPA